MNIRWMKKLWIVAGLALTVGAVEAGPGGGPRGGPERMQMRVQKMKEALSLTDDQVTQIEAIFKEAAAQGQADRAQARERHRKIAEKIDAVLTEEQRAKHAELREQFRKNHRGGRFRGGPGGEPAPGASPVPDGQ
jgi:Spy/CpxP family protein refolding chaperone